MKTGQRSPPHKRTRTRPTHMAVTGIVALWLARPICAAELNVTIADKHGNGVENAVVELIVDPGATTPVTPLPTSAEMRQRDKQFAPGLLLIPAGASVDFPNEDPILHHVYSFSPAKQFELRLYGNEQVPSIIFDRTGPVALGCNIHDNMRGHIYVSAATYFGLTLADGTGRFGDVRTGSYTASVWHPRLRKPKDRPGMAVVFDAAQDQGIRLLADVRPDRIDVIDKYERGNYE